MATKVTIKDKISGKTVVIGLPKKSDDYVPPTYFNKIKIADDMQGYSDPNPARPATNLDRMAAENSAPEANIA